MAPVVQKKVSVADMKESPAQMRQDAEEQIASKEEEQKDEERQEASECAGVQKEENEDVRVPASVDVSDTVEDADASALEKVEKKPTAKDELAVEEEETNDDETKAAQTEEIAATGENTAAGEDAEGMKEEDNEGSADAENINAGEEDVPMRNVYDNEAEGSDGEGDGEANAETDAMAKDDSTDLSVGKIFLGGLSRETTTEALTRHFEKYGELTDSVIMKNRSTGQPRGFGFVTYADPSVVDRVLQDTHVLDGRAVDAKRTVPREKMAAEVKESKSKKIFVGGLTSSTTEEDLTTYFGKFGKISGCQIMQDHRIRKSRGFGFVTFDSEQAVEDILSQGKMHEIDGKQVEIKKAEPKRGNEPPPAPIHNRSSYFSGGRRGAGYNANPGYFGAFNTADAPYYGGAPGYYNRSGARAGGLAYGDNYGYGGSLGYGDIVDGYGGMSYNHAGYASGSYGSAGSYAPGGPYGSGSGYGYNYGGGGGYGPSSRGYGSGRYHPYSR